MAPLTHAMPVANKHMVCTPTCVHTATSYAYAGVDVKDFVYRLAAGRTMPHYVARGPPSPESKRLPAGFLTWGDAGDEVAHAASEPLHIVLSSVAKPLVTERPVSGVVVSGLYTRLAAAFPSRSPAAVINYLDALLKHEDELSVDKLEQHLDTNKWAFRALASFDQEGKEQDLFDMVRKVREHAERKLALHCTLKVERFPKNATEDELWTEIMKHASVRKLRISRDKVDDDGRRKILAFVEMATIEDATHLVALCTEGKVVMRAAGTNWSLRAEWSKRGLADTPLRRHRRGTRGGRREVQGGGKANLPTTSPSAILPLLALCSEFSLETPSRGQRPYASSPSTATSTTCDSPGHTNSACSGGSDDSPSPNFANFAHSLLPARIIASNHRGEGSCDGAYIYI
eukprot:NODE_5965_length_1717_cov_4.400000.p1 GENE.NODE_5965_length_1717_cov_4.400000~~NODE_5965_length_1717_cov_4.400000.p1  ORF type:complete len:401 (+),score=61.33 NODE_5965_length_1717_cov_4.400000:58-1260(+)